MTGPGQTPRERPGQTPRERPGQTPRERDDRASEVGVAEAVRSAVERTMRATAGSASSTRDRAADLVDDVVRRGLEARARLSRRGLEAGAELGRRSQEAGAGLARRGQEATEEVARRLEALDRRLVELETRLGDARDTADTPTPEEPESKPRAED
jgi:polyhydroxyalkanoate synthesis regulator phasin